MALTMKTRKLVGEASKKIAIIALKKRYGALYGKIMNYENYNCGHAMQLVIDSRYLKMCKEFNKIADRLSKLDHSFFRWYRRNITNLTSLYETTHKMVGRIR